MTDGDMVEAVAWLHSATITDLCDRIEQLERELAEAVEAERERCAGIVEHYNFGPERTERDNARNSIAQIIAAAIRTGEADALRDVMEQARGEHVGKE